MRHRNLEQPAEKGPKPRIESLSDLVFGLALGIGGIALVNNPPSTPEGMYRDIAIFAFSFLIIISIWLRYTRIMSVLPIETRTTMLLNTLLLFTVILEPFIYNILRTGNTSSPPSLSLFESASALFGVDLGAMMLVMGVFTLALADEERRLVPDRMMRQFRLEAASWFVSSAIFLVSALPFFGKIDLSGVVTTGFTIRQVMWLVALFIALVSRAARSNLDQGT
jgi:uncharacterized membrane protein